MLTPASGPLDVAPERVHRLFVALNSPVVALEGGSPAPASAGIAVHATGGVTLVIRASRSGRLAFYQAELSEPASGGLGIADAFAHAEELGFLFDEEQPLGGGSERSGWPLWLAEIFRAEAADELTGLPAGESLTKFRWALPTGTGVELIDAL